MLIQGISLDKYLCWPWQDRLGETAPCCWSWCKVDTTQLCAYCSYLGLDQWKPKPMEKSSVRREGVFPWPRLCAWGQRDIHTLFITINPWGCHINSDNHLSLLQVSQQPGFPATEVLQHHHHLPSFTASPKYQIIIFLQLCWEVCQVISCDCSHTQLEKMIQRVK